MLTEQIENQNVPEIKVRVSNKVSAKDRPKITSVWDSHRILKQIFDADTFDWTESFVMLCLNRRNQVIGFYKISHGGTSSTVVDPKVIFTVALNVPGTCGLIVAHNHPSGNTEPSKADEEITKKLVAGGKLLEITILDHMILAEDSFYSFASEGLI